MIWFIIGAAIGSAGVALTIRPAIIRQEQRIRSLLAVHRAAHNLSTELVCDPVNRNVTWFYDGASALNKVQQLHAALDAALEAKVIEP